MQSSNDITKFTYLAVIIIFRYVTSLPLNNAKSIGKRDFAYSCAITAYLLCPHNILSYVHVTSKKDHITFKMTNTWGILLVLTSQKINTRVKSWKTN